MEPETFDFKPETRKVSRELEATLAKTQAALQEMWKREKREAQTVYEITIPAQTPTIFGREHAEHTLQTLKSLKLSGTYRITKK